MSSHSWGVGSAQEVSKSFQTCGVSVAEEMKMSCRHIFVAGAVLAALAALAVRVGGVELNLRGRRREL